MAENAASSLKKGARVIVTGRLEQRSYETKEGDNTVKRSVVEIIADEVGPSLRWATAQVEKTQRRTGEAAVPATEEGAAMAVPPRRADAGAAVRRLRRRAVLIR